MSASTNNSIQFSSRSNFPQIEEKSELHKEMKLFRNLLIDSKWSEAFEVYLRLPDEIKQELNSNILEKMKSLPMEFPFVFEENENGIGSLTILSFNIASREEEFSKQKSASSNRIFSLFSRKNEPQIQKNKFASDFLSLYLLPKIDLYILSNFKPEKHKNILEAANEAFTFTRANIEISPNFPKHTNKIFNYVVSKSTPETPFVLSNVNEVNDINLLNSEGKEKARQVFEKLKFNGKLLKGKFSIFLSENNINNSFLKILFIAQFFAHFKMGNCTEISCLGFYSLLKNKKVKQFNYCRIVNGDHALLFLGPMSKINIAMTRAFLFLDSWSDRENFYFSEGLLVKLRNYLGVNTRTFETLREKFDPNKHSIEVVVTNLFSVKDFDKKINTSSDDNAIKTYREKLVAFHQAKSEEEKNSIAKAISNMKLKIYHPQNKELIRILKSQMRCYVDICYADLLYLGPKIEIPSVFELDVQAQKFAFIPALVFDKVLQIRELYLEGDAEKANKKLKKLSPDIQFFISTKAKQSSMSLRAQPSVVNPVEHVHANASLAWILDKIIVALENKNESGAQKIYQKLPDDVKQAIEDRWNSSEEFFERRGLDFAPQIAVIKDYLMAFN